MTHNCNEAETREWIDKDSILIILIERTELYHLKVKFASRRLQFGSFLSKNSFTIENKEEWRNIQNECNFFNTSKTAKDSHRALDSNASWIAWIEIQYQQNNNNHDEIYRLWLLKPPFGNKWANQNQIVHKIRGDREREGENPHDLKGHVNRIMMYEMKSIYWRLSFAFLFIVHIM